MLRTGAAVIAVSLLVAAPAAGESPLVVVDSVGTVLGEVVDVAGSGVGATIAYPLSTGGSAIIKADVGGFSSSVQTSYYELLDCEGTIYLQDGVAPGPTNMMNPAHFVTFDFPESTAIIVQVQRDSVPQVIMEASRFNEINCLNETPYPRSVVPAQYVEVLKSYIPPLSVTANPSIFWDQFQTGDMSRWSNY